METTSLRDSKLIIVFLEEDMEQKVYYQNTGGMKVSKKGGKTKEEK